jgi:hypothetical protein
LQYEIVSKTDHSFVPHLNGTEAEVKLDNCRNRAKKEVSVPVHTICRAEMSDIYAQGYDVVTKYQNTIMLRPDSVNNGEKFWVLSNIRQTPRKLYFRKKFYVWPITAAFFESIILITGKNNS